MTDECHEKRGYRARDNGFKPPTPPADTNSEQGMYIAALKEMKEINELYTWLEGKGRAIELPGAHAFFMEVVAKRGKVLDQRLADLYEYSKQNS